MCVFFKKVFFFGKKRENNGPLLRETRIHFFQKPFPTQYMSLKSKKSCKKWGNSVFIRLFLRGFQKNHFFHFFQHFFLKKKSLFLRNVSQSVSKCSKKTVFSSFFCKNNISAPYKSILFCSKSMIFVISLARGAIFRPGFSKREGLE